MGLLTNAGPQSWHPADDELKAVCKNAGDYCVKNGVELGKLAIYYALQLKGQPTFLIGMQSTALFETNMNVYYNGLTSHEMAVLKHVQETYFKGVYRQHWEGVEVNRYWEAMRK